jgi:hypothetical protein
MTKSLFFLGVITVLLSACGRPEYLSYNEFLEFVKDEENGFVKTQELNEIKYEATYIPSELREYVSMKKTGKKNANSNNISFKVKIAMISGKDILKSNISTVKDFNMELMYLNTEMQKDFMLINDTDTSYCNLIVPEYIDGITPYLTLNLVFTPKRKIKKDIMLVYTDNLFTSEKINFLFSKNTFIDLPKIK